MKRFTTPTSQPITIGDQFTLFRKSVEQPVVPVVDDVKVEEVKEKEEEEVVVEKDGGNASEDSKEDTGEKDTAEKVGEKRSAESDIQSETNKKEKSTGGEAAAVPKERTTLEGSSSKDGEGSDSVHTEREPSSPKQETERSSGTGEVQ